jgi:hypothetical protein
LRVYRKKKSAEVNSARKMRHVLPPIASSDWKRKRHDRRAASANKEEGVQEDRVKQAQAQSSMDNPAGVSPPAISLPKGGGAIRGIGEKFAANPFTGTGSLSVTSLHSN